MKQSVQELLVAVNKRVQLMGKSKDHMKVRGVHGLSPALIHPNLLKDSLTVRTVAVTAGVIVGFQMSAIRTLA